MPLFFRFLLLRLVRRFGPRMARVVYRRFLATPEARARTASWLRGR